MKFQKVVEPICKYIKYRDPFANYEDQLETFENFNYLTQLSIFYFFLIYTDQFAIFYLNLYFGFQNVGNYLTFILIN